jgi:hypothetical protein
MKSDMVLVHRQVLLDLKVDDFFELLTLAIAQYPVSRQHEISDLGQGPASGKTGFRDSKTRL